MKLYCTYVLVPVRTVQDSVLPPLRLQYLDVVAVLRRLHFNGCFPLCSIFGRRDFTIRFTDKWGRFGDFGDDFARQLSGILRVALVWVVILGQGFRGVLGHAKRGREGEKKREGKEGKDSGWRREKLRGRGRKEKQKREEESKGQMSKKRRNGNRHE
jgi:hypothetical protein